MKNKYCSSKKTGTFDTSNIIKRPKLSVADVIPEQKSFKLLKPPSKSDQPKQKRQNKNKTTTTTTNNKKITTMFSPIVKTTPVVEKTTTKNSSKITSNTRILNNKGTQNTDVHCKENHDLPVLINPVLPNTNLNFNQPDLAPEMKEQQSSNQQLSDEVGRPNDSLIRPNNIKSHNMNASCSQLNRNLRRNHIRFENVCKYDLYPKNQ